MSVVPLASIGEDVAPIMALMIPIIALIIPIVVLMAKHQQRMAEILHRGHQSQEFEALRAEVADLKSLIHQQAFAIDRLSNPVLSTETERLRAL